MDNSRLVVGSGTCNVSFQSFRQTVVLSDPPEGGSHDRFKVKLGATTY